MAIQFNKALGTSVLFSINNNVAEFYSDSSEIPLNTEITINGAETKIIYPHPNGTFYFNFKDYIESVINLNGNSDNLDFEISTTFYDWSDVIYNDEQITIQINFLNDTNEQTLVSPKWLHSYTKKNERYYNQVLDANGFYLLSGTNDITKREETLYIWNGYPFDFTILKTISSTLTIPVGFSSINFPNNKVTRCLVSDGVATTDLFQSPIQFFNGVTEIYRINLDIIDNCGGYYVKWINRYGGWNYYLFEHGSESLKTKDLGEVAQNNNNIENTIESFKQIGKQSFQSITVFSDTLNEHKQALLKDLFESPKIYLYTGEKGTTSTFEDWIEVRLTNTSYTTKQPKSILNDFTLTFELPDNDTRRL